MFLICFIKLAERDMNKRLKLFNLIVHRTKFNASYTTSAANVKDDKLDPANCRIALNPYYIENGLRKVYPYSFTHKMYCKGRWMNKNLIDCYHKEYSLYPREEYIKRVLKGQLRVNGKTVGTNYILKSNDHLTQTIHKHELAVLATTIPILYEDDDFLVIDKPPSMPVHACALYAYNTVAEILRLEQNYQSLFITHRLDRLTSGVLIFAKSSAKSSHLHSNNRLRTVKKEYICRVEGNFPDETIVCNKPILQMYNKVGASVVHENGRPCITEFQKLSFNGKSSVVLCKPYTGRTHQIRVHLQFLGHPIIKDPLYNSYVFGPEKGKNGVTKPLDELMADLTVEHSTQWWLENAPEKPVADYESELGDTITKMYCRNSGDIFSSAEYKKDPSKLTHEDDCYFCNKAFRDPRQTYLLMFLHAYKYQCDDWEFSTKFPLWAEENWCIL